MLNNFCQKLKEVQTPPKKRLNKLGTLDIGVVETTPVVWKDKLYRFEWVRNKKWGDGNIVKLRDVGCYRFVDMTDETPVAEFAIDHSFGCCYAENGKMYVLGTRGGGGGNFLDLFVSENLINWEQHTAIEFPSDIHLFNTSICKGDGKYIAAIEVGGSLPEIGVNFTIFYAESENLIDWKLMDIKKYSYDTARYTACPVIKYYGGLYYMIYLESAPCHRWLPYIVRTADFVNYEIGTTNPVMYPDDNDKKIVYPWKMTEEQISTILNSPDTNNSDVDLCEYRGKTVIMYSWGNQLGREHLAVAEYDGSEEEFLTSFFD